MSEIEKTEVEQDSEDRSLSNPPKWLSDALRGGLSTSSGITVTEDTALSITAVYAAVRVIAETVSSLPLKVYAATDRGRDEYRTSPLWSLVHDTPNSQMSSYTFREVMTGMALTHGNAYAEIVRDGAGRPAELWPLLPENVTVHVLADNEIIYLYSGQQGGQVPLDSNQVLHIKNFSTDGIVGKSPIRLAREALGLSVAAEQMGGERFSNASHPGGVLEHPGKLSTEGLENLRKSWEAMHRGVANSSRVAVLEEGMKFHNISIPSDDAQWIETRRFQVSEIARLYRVPPHTIADLDRATYANIEAQQLSFYRDTLLPWLSRWEQEIARKLINEKEGVYVEHVIDGLLRGDTEARYASYKIARDAGILSVNEIRSMENKNPIEGGDIYLQPLNMVAVGDDPTAYVEEVQEEDREVGTELSPHILSWLKEACARALAIEANTGRRSATKHLEKKHNPKKLIDEMTRASKKLPDRLVEITKPIVESIDTDAELLNSMIRVEASEYAEQTLRGAAQIVSSNNRDALVASAELKNWYDETTSVAASELAESIYGAWSNSNGK